MSISKIVGFLFKSRKTSSDVPIRVFFLRMLAWCAFLSLIFSVVVSISFDIREINGDFFNVSRARINELQSHANRSRGTSDALKRQAKKTAGRFATLLAEVIAENPGILNVDPKESDEGKAGLGLMMNRVGLTEISVVGPEGIVIAGYPSSNIGVDFHNPPLDEFLQLLDSNEPVVQEIRPNVNDPNDFRMYAGARRLDQPGFVQVGLEADPLERFFKLGDLVNFIEPSPDQDVLFAVFSAARGFEVGDESLSRIDLFNLKHDKIESVKLDGRTYLVLARQSDDLTYVYASKLRSLIRARLLTVALLIIANFFIFFVIFFLISFLIRKFIVESVYKINGSLEKITNGDLDERVDVTTSKEFTDLSNGVNMTVDALKSATEEITKRVEEELAVAQKIQADALPDLEKRFAQEERFDVYGANRPMHRIGGDMYDFFFLNDDRVMFYVADVSGHGVPAALVMMKTMALVKNLALSKKRLPEVITLTNEYLSENNSSMFVTGFFCVLDLKTGVLTYVNAGHNPPFLRRKGGKYEVFEPRINLLLGIGSYAPYESAEIQLEPGDEFLLYTDGITEATAPDIDLFETDRALDALNKVDEKTSAKKTANALFAAVDRFTNNAEPSDDQTLLLFKLNRLG
ncbi:MAG: SpoIIE family protein phosphatase [Thermoguttaceae bacterium]|nr:SpoIIE family protein phosphatase [Thermoguttaceae bacterium]